MKKPEHICTRMVDYIESKNIVVSKWEQKASESGQSVSVGYLRKSAKNDFAIGHNLIAYFLAEFSEVSANWLITGEGEPTGKEAKDTAWREPFVKIELSIKKLQKEAENLKGRIELLEEKKTASPGKKVKTEKA